MKSRCGQAAVFSPADYEKLINATVGENHKLIFRLAYWTAARMGEVCQLKTADVYGRDGSPLDTVTYPKEITKCGKTRQVPVTDTVKKFLKLYWLEVRPDYNGFLFPGATRGSHLQFQSADDAFRRAVKKAGLVDRGYRTHSFRRSAATKLASNGIGLRVIQEITGHSSLQSLQRYIEVSPEQVKTAIATL
jgi:integrase/recombinase XerD